MSREKVISYLSRITGKPVVGDKSVALSSAQRAALASWLRRERINVDPAAVNSGGFTVNDLLNGGPLTQLPAVASKVTMSDASNAHAGNIRPLLGIGIDIQEISFLPEANDYRGHQFYRDNFSATEIAYCIQQPIARASFCGLWAAKEAILKAGAATASHDGLRGIEITHDDAGRPGFVNCMVSISHTQEAAVAVCVWLGSAISLIPKAT